MSKPNRDSVLRTLWPLLFPLAALLLQLGLWPETQPYTWLPFTAAVLFTAWLSGMGGGLVATVLSVLLAWWFFVEPSSTLQVIQARDALALMLFLVVGGLTSLVVGQLRRSQAEAGRALTQAQAASAELQQRETRHRQLIELAPDAVFIADANGRYTEANATACRMLGYRHDELIGKTVRDLVAPVDQARLDQTREQLLAGATATAEWVLLRKDGSELPVEATSRLLPDGGRQSFVRDISARRRLERELAVSHAELVRAQTMAQVGSWQLSGATQRITFSEEAYRIFGGSPDGSMTLEQARTLIHPDDRKKVLARWEAALAGDRFDLEHRILAGETVKWVHHRAELDLSAEGELLSALGTVQDITELKRSELALRESEEQVRLLLESTGEGMFGVDLDGNCTFINPAALRLLGMRDASELIGKKIHLYIHGQSPQGLPHPEHECRVYRAFLERRGFDVDDEQFVRADGTAFDVQYRSYPILRDGAVLGAVASFADISERKRADRLLRQAAIVFDSTMEGIMVTDAERRIVAVNQAFTTITGYSADEALGRNPGFQRSGRHGDDFYRQLWAALERSGQWQGEIWNRRKNGELYPALESINITRDADGRICNYVGVFSDISAIKQAEEKLTHLAHHDALTGLPNRLLFSATLEKSLQHAGRQQTRVALLFLDLDRFKVINDSLGHAAGDQLLQEIGRRLEQRVRAEDTVARLGGDEFTVIAEAIDSPDDAAHLATGIIEAIAKPVRIDGREVVTSTSIGISIFPDDAQSAGELAKAADAAMYRAKERGRNTFEFFTAEITARAQENLAIEQDLRQALAAGELRLHYQPQLDLASNRVVGVEALIRWQHPEEGLLMPGHFIDIAEESGLISAIGEWAIHEACAQAADWRRQGLPPLRIGINLSGRQLARDQLTETLHSALHGCGLTTDDVELELEVTEGILQEMKDSVGQLERLRELGSLIAIDDFGTGYSSLTRLKELPIDTLKIDQAFVRNLPEDRGNQAITAAIVSMGHSLGLRVIAEGVETDAQLAVLREQDCDEIQGFLVGRALPPERIAALLQQPPPSAARH